MPSRAIQAACVAGFGLLMLAAVAAAALSGLIPTTGYLLRDTAALAEVSPWLGSVATFNNLAWAVAATLNVVAGLAEQGSSRGRLLSLGVVTMVLAVDDSFQLHELVLPDLGVPEMLVLAAYALSGLALASYWLPLRHTAIGAAFYMGVFLLASGVLVDLVLPDRILFSVLIDAGLRLVEDGAKLMGALAWTVCGAWGFSEAVTYLRSRAGLA